MEVFKASPRDRAQQRFLVQITSTLLFLTLVEEVLGEVFKASPKDRAQQRFVEQNMLTLLFTVVEEVLGEVFKASPKDRAHQRFDTPVPHGRGGGPRGGLQGLSQGQGSSAVCGAENVDIPVPHGRAGKRGLHGFPRGQSSTASAVEQTVGVDRGGLQGFPRGQSFTVSAVEQTFSLDSHRSLPRAPVHGRHDEWMCMIDVENDGEYFWNRCDNSTCWRLPRGVKHRWCLLPSSLYRDVVLQADFRDLPPL